MYLHGTTDKLQLTTSAAVTVDVDVDWVDRTTDGSSTVIASGSTRAAITTATTTDIAAAPGSGKTRQVNLMTARNKHATTPVDVTVIIDVSATDYEVYKVTLAAGQTLLYDTKLRFIVLEPQAQYLKSRQILSASATYTTPAGIRAILITAFGAGGGGGGVANAATNSGAAGGGGAGAKSQTLIQNPAATYAVTIGAAGTGATAGANTGGTGGDTIVGSVCTAKGGLGGVGDTIATIHVGGLGGAGGPASSGVGDLKGDGMAGSGGLALAAAIALSGEGGSAEWSPGAIGKRNATTAGGAPPTAGGGGGSGACAISGGASQAGGAGAAGLAIFDEFA